jgi:hypothetical protein
MRSPQTINNTMVALVLNTHSRTVMRSNLEVARDGRSLLFLSQVLTFIGLEDLMTNAYLTILLLLQGWPCTDS